MRRLVLHPISTARKVLVWTKGMVSGLIDYIIVLTFSIVFAIITRLKHIRPSTRERLSAVVLPQRARRPIFPSFPLAQRSETPKPTRTISSPLPPKLPLSPLPDHQFLTLTSNDDAASDTAVGSVIEADLPSPTLPKAEHKLREAETAARLITSRAQRLADGMLSSAAALHDTWVQDAHRQYNAIVAKAREETEPLAAAQLEELRRRIDLFSVDRSSQTTPPAIKATADMDTQTEEERAQVLGFSGIYSIEEEPLSPAFLTYRSKYSSLILDEGGVPLPFDHVPAAPMTPPKPHRSISSPSPIRPATAGEARLSESPSPSRPKRLTKRPKSMDLGTTLASLSPSDASAVSVKRSVSSGKRGMVKELMESLKANKLFAQNGHHGEEGSSSNLVDVARSTSKKNGKGKEDK